LNVLAFSTGFNNDGLYGFDAFTHVLNVELLQNYYIQRLARKYLPFATTTRKPNDRRF
jgi:hypothetical protein